MCPNFPFQSCGSFSFFVPSTFTVKRVALEDIDLSTVCQIKDIIHRRTTEVERRYLLVKVMRKSRLIHYINRSKEDKWPFQVSFLQERIVDSRQTIIRCAMEITFHTFFSLLGSHLQFCICVFLVFRQLRDFSSLIGANFERSKHLHNIF